MPCKAVPRLSDSIESVGDLHGELYSVLAESAPDAIIAIDEDSIIISANSAVERLFGYAPHEIIGKPLSLLMPSRMHGSHYAGVARYLGTGARHISWQSVRLTILTKGGAEIPVEVSFGEFVSDGRRVFSGFVRDISDRVAAEQAVSAARREAEARAVEAEHLATQLQDQATELEQSNLELHSAVSQLRESEERYRALVEASTLMVWSTDATGMVEDIPVWRELTGQTPDEVRGNGWTDAIHPDDRGRTITMWRAAHEVRSVYQAEYRVRLANGTYRWYRSRGVPVIGSDGEVREWIGVFDDIDQAMRHDVGTWLLAEASVALAESRGERGTLETVAKLAIDGLADGCMITLVASDGSFEHVAIQSREDHIADMVADMERMYPVPTDAPSGYPRVIRTGEAELITEGAFDDVSLPSAADNAEHVALLRRVGMYSAMVVPLTARGRTLGAMTLVLHGPVRRAPFDVQDLTIASELGRRAGIALDNARAYAAERAAREEAESANRVRSDFLATMSHELRTPLNAIAGYVELIEMGLRGEVTDAQREDLTRIRRSQRRLLSLVNDVLSFARIDAGQVHYDITDVALDDIIAGVEALVLPQLRAKGLAYTFDPASCLFTVRADRERLEQILINLLSNAIKFTVTGGMVTVTCEARYDAMLIHVSDTGIGVPEENLNSIFDPFVQVESGHTRTAEGTGLGLAISRELATGMGAGITVQSERGIGSTFTVVFPAFTEPAPEQAPEQASEQAHG